ncbi:hypothetical protein MtrunA17_Chr3g0090271 [Medicago truncatula]|uniref:Uncharacterized protein n=1 Tax=Medicago truncatula TaxID=3880 RepID=A0A396INR1_MEDTR|nr:hypothetical protein MtrunA17_Chr3g0090271 [Medicago truncatula]
MCKTCPFYLQNVCYKTPLVENLEPHLLREKGCDYKTMNSAAQKIGGGIIIDSAVSGWNKKLFIPLKKHSTSNGKTMILELELQETENLEVLILFLQKFWKEKHNFVIKWLLFLMIQVTNLVTLIFK